MPEREFITDADVCDLAGRWGVELDTVRRVWSSAFDYEQQTLGQRVWIISGYRTAAEQQKLARQGRPTASDRTSTHRSCPATGVDISLGFLPSNFQKVMWGRIVFANGLRWGGGGPVDPDSLIPVDWPHVDRGPRRP